MAGIPGGIEVSFAGSAVEASVAPAVSHCHREWKSVVNVEAVYRMLECREAPVEATCFALPDPSYFHLSQITCILSRTFRVRRLIGGSVAIAGIMTGVYVTKQLWSYATPHGRTAENFDPLLLRHANSGDSWRSCGGKW